MLEHRGVIYENYKNYRNNIMFKWLKLLLNIISAILGSGFTIIMLFIMIKIFLIIYHYHI